VPSRHHECYERGLLIVSAIRQADPVSVFTKALKAVHSYLYTRLVFGSTVVDMNANSSCLLRTDLGPLVAGTWASFSASLHVSAIGNLLHIGATRSVVVEALPPKLPLVPATFSGAADMVAQGVTSCTVLKDSPAQEEFWSRWRLVALEAED
jgi:hypothetical protein